MVWRSPAGEPVEAASHHWEDSASVAVAPDGLEALTGRGERDAWEAVDSAPDPVICHCMQVRLGTLEACMLRGYTTQEELARETGATTVCGGCTSRVAELVGGASGYPARLEEVREVLPSVRSFRFARLHPGEGLLRTPRAGQHVVVSALIDGTWVSRPYTLTSWGSGGEFHEVTVARQPGGRLSSWLFEQRVGQRATIRVTEPRGEFHLDLARPEPIIFFAAGIGITPAVAFARALATAGSGSPLFIDYSEREAAKFAFRPELERLVRTSRQVGVRFRATRGGQRLGAAAVQAYSEPVPDARYCICGPDSYQQAVQAYLAAAGVDESRIKIERFNTAARSPSVRLAGLRVVTGVPTANGRHAGAPDQDLPRPPAATRGWGSRALGLSLLLVYLLQGILGWNWPWLEALQAEESYRRWSGALLLGFIAVQWALPVLRLSGRFQAAARAYPWHRWFGAVAPVLFYAHATWLGYGYLLALGSVYLANVLVGHGDKTVIRELGFRERYARTWLVVHVALACLTVGLTLFHVYVVFAYK